MLDKEKFVKVVRTTRGLEVNELIIYTIAWAVTDEEAIEILSATKPNYKFYDKLYEFLKSVGYGDMEDIKEIIDFFELNIERFESWIDYRREEINRTGNPRGGMTE